MFVSPALGPPLRELRTIVIACLSMFVGGLARGQDALTIEGATPLILPTTVFGGAPIAAAKAASSREVAEGVPVETFDFSSMPTVPPEFVPIDDGANWFNSLRVGYDGGFVLASRRESDLDAGTYPFMLKINGWGQLRHSALDSSSNQTDLNQFQLKRGRVVFSGNAFEREFRYFIQMDGRSTDGDDVRLLDYYLSYDAGHVAGGLERGVFMARIGRYKMPFHMARWISGKEFEFSDRSVASTFFDVNRSLAWGLFGASPNCRLPFDWEVAIFNGLVTGGAETGSSGTLDDNFAYSGRLFLYPLGEWGAGEIADFDWHEELALRVGGGFAGTTIDRFGFTEFQALRVVDSGQSLSSLLPVAVTEYDVRLFAMHFSTKYRGLSTNFEFYFRSTGEFEGAPVAQLNDHGFWLQVGKFLVPRRWQVLSRWSRVVGTSGSLGAVHESTEEIALGLAHYFEKQNAKLVFDATYLNGSPISSPTLDISPRDEGFLYRTQLQFSF